MGRSNFKNLSSIKKTELLASFEEVVNNSASRPKTRELIEFNAQSPAHIYLDSIKVKSAESCERALNSIAKIVCENFIEVNVAVSKKKMDDLDWTLLNRVVVNKILRYLESVGRTPNTIGKYLSVIKGVMKEAKYLNLISYDHYQSILDIKQLKGSREPAGTALPMDLVEQALGQCDLSTAIGVRDYAIILVLVGAGLRRDECSKLNYEDINFNRKTIKVIGKGDKERILHCYEEVISAIKAWVKHFRGEKEGPLFLQIRKGNSLTEKRLSDTGIYFICRKIGDKIHENQLKPHNLRRTLATNMHSQGVAFSNIQDYLGHSLPSTTMRYIRNDKEEATKQAIDNSTIFGAR